MEEVNAVLKKLLWEAKNAYKYPGESLEAVEYW
jgi:hypothetical protein